MGRGQGERGAEESAKTILGAGSPQIFVRFLVGLLDFGFGVGVRLEFLNGFSETDGTLAGYFCFERIEAARDIKILRDMGGRHTLAQVLEPVAGHSGILAG